MTNIIYSDWAERFAQFTREKQELKNRDEVRFLAYRDSINNEHHEPLQQSFLRGDKW